MNKYIVFFIFLVIINLGYIGYKIFLDPDNQETGSHLDVITLNDLGTELEGASVEYASWDDLTLGIFFDNGYQLSIPYHWEIYERHSESEEPVLSKDDYVRKDENDIEKKQCTILEKENFLGFGTMNSSLIMHFENYILAIPINYHTPDGNVLIAVGDPSHNVLKLRM